MGPDAGKLMNTGQAADNRVIFHMDMAGQIGRIDHNDMMTQLAVVSDMTIGHNQVMVAQDRDPNIRHCCPMDRDKFPNGIIISDHDPGGLPSELQVLGLNTDRSKLKDTASLTDIGMGLNDYMGTDDGIFPYMDIRTDNRIGTNFNPLRQFGIRRNDCCRMNFHVVQSPSSYLACNLASSISTRFRRAVMVWRISGSLEMQASVRSQSR